MSNVLNGQTRPSPAFCRAFGTRWPSWSSASVVRPGRMLPAAPLLELIDDVPATRPEQARVLLRQRDQHELPGLDGSPSARCSSIVSVQRSVSIPRRSTATTTTCRRRRERLSPRRLSNTHARGWRVFPLHGIVNGVCTCGRTRLLQRRGSTRSSAVGSTRRRPTRSRSRIGGAGGAAPTSASRPEQCRASW